MRIEITIDSGITISNVSEDYIRWLIDKLTFDNPKYEEALKYNRSTYGIPMHIKMFKLTPNGIRIPRGYLQTIEDTIITPGYLAKVRDNRVLSPTIFDSNIVLRSYQRPAEDGMLLHPNGMLVAPAGSGKTMMGLNMCALTNQKTLWLTHTKPLVRQVKNRILGSEEESLPPAFNDIDPKRDIGILGDSKWSIGDKFTIGIVQTLVRRVDQLHEIGREFGLVIVDECHHVPSSTFLKVIEHFSSYYLYGLTATPVRRDRMENIMFSVIGRANAMIDRNSVKKEKGIITPTVIVRSIRSSTVEDNDYHPIINDVVMPNKQRQLTIVEDVLREAQNGHYCIVVSTRKEYCETLHELIKPHWDKVAIANGDYSDKHNEEQIRRLSNREINVLITTINLLGEGFDVQHLDRGFFVLPFKWSGMVEQAVGRIQRSCAVTNKRDALIYDYVDIDIGILKNQFRHRLGAYKALGMHLAEV